MKVKICILSILLVLLNSADAQSWQWGRRGGGGCGLSCNRDEDIKDLKCDANGNIYFLSRLDGGGDENLQTGNGDSVDIGTIKGGVPGALLASYNSCGKLRWKKVFYCNNGEVRPTAMSMDTLGHITVALESDADFHCDSDSFTANTKRKTISIVQYDTIGKFKWLRQSNSDTASITTNLTKNRIFGIYSMPDGDIYAFCGLSPGLVSGSSNIIVSTNDLYMLKYSSTGVPKELIKLDINMNGSAFDRWNFSVTQSRKFIFNMAKTYGTGYTATSPLVGGQPANHRLFLCCFNPNGTVAWRFTDTDTTGGLQGRPCIDESTGVIYSAGFTKGRGVPDTIGGVAIVNPYSVTSLPILLCTDTNGVFKWVNWPINSRSNAGISNSGVVKLSNNQIGVVGSGNDLQWGTFKYTGIGVYAAKFNAINGSFISMDSLAGSSSPLADVIVADKNDNIYIGGRIYSDITVAGQTLQSYGGLNDFFIAKYGSTCILPLAMINYKLLIINNSLVLNEWTTANEINVSHYNIERSFNGNDFTIIGKVKANNKSSNEYRFEDNVKTEELIDRKTVYYRVVGVDYDGRKTYSTIKQITLKPQTPNNVFVFPNPAKDVVNVVGSNIKEVKLFDMFGREIASFLAMTGNTYKLIINNHQLAKGLYVVQVILTNGATNNEKIIVQ